MCEMMTHWSEKPLRHWNGRDEGQWRLEGNVKATEALKGKNERLKRAKLWLTLENNQLTRRQNTTHQTSSEKLKITDQEHYRLENADQWSKEAEVPIGRSQQNLLAESRTQTTFSNPARRDQEALSEHADSLFPWTSIFLFFSWQGYKDQASDDRFYGAWFER
ncbi:hypothetical protein Tco_0673603 [Tanacetum coccineum]